MDTDNEICMFLLITLLGNEHSTASMYILNKYKTLDSLTLKQFKLFVTTFVKSIVLEDPLKCCLINKIPSVCNKVIVKESPIHDRGVFATRQINKGEIITFYPCHDVEHDDCIFTPCNEKYKDFDFHYDYSITLNEAGLDMNIHSDQNEYSNMCLVGHIVNDPCPKDVIEYIEKSNNTYENMLRYYIETNKRENSELFRIGNFVAVVALRDIMVDEEILAKYDYLYWKTHSKDHNGFMTEKVKTTLDILRMNQKQKRVIHNLSEMNNMKD